MKESLNPKDAKYQAINLASLLNRLPLEKVDKELIKWVDSKSFSRSELQMIAKEIGRLHISGLPMNKVRKAFGLPHLSEKNRSRVLLDLIEEVMSQETALSILDISRDGASDPAELKKAYKRAAMLAHPDRGGDEEQMKRVNQAYDVLKKHGGGFLTRKSPVDWDAINKEIELYKKVAKKYLEDNFDAKAFLKHFQSFDPQFQITREEVVSDTKHVLGDSSVHGYYEFSTPDKQKVFKLYISINANNLRGRANLGSSDFDVPMFVSTEVYANGRAQKIKQKDYQFSSNKKILIRPNEVFPSTRLKKIFTGQTRKSGQFKRRDMEAFLRNELDAVLSGDDAHIPVGDKVLWMRRNVIMRQPGWQVMGIFEPKEIGGSIYAMGRPLINIYKSSSETEQDAKILKDIVKGEKDYKKVAARLKSEWGVGPG